MDRATTHITWLIEKDVFQDNDISQRMTDVVRNLGMEAKSYRYVGFDGGTEPKDLPEQESCIIAYGSLNAAKFISKHCRWVPGVWCNFKKLKCSTYLSYWGKFSVQNPYVFLPLIEVERKKEWLYYVLGNNDAIFIRPDDNAKSFHGEIVAYSQFEKWLEVANIYDPGPECMTMISRVQDNIIAEYRFVIADRKVITGSQYQYDCKLAIDAYFDPKAAELAEQIANFNEFNPHPIYVMDICKTIAGKYFLLEIGSMNAAGLYACDLVEVVKKASEIAEREWKELQE